MAAVDATCAVAPAGQHDLADPHIFRPDALSSVARTPAAVGSSATSAVPFSTAMPTVSRTHSR